jgi:hypothetical protein
MDREITSKDVASLQYERPRVTDLGDLAELTQTSTSAGLTDVPEKTPGYPGAPIFSPA